MIPKILYFELIFFLLYFSCCIFGETRPLKDFTGISQNVKSTFQFRHLVKNGFKDSTFMHRLLEPDPLIPSASEPDDEASSLVNTGILPENVSTQANSTRDATLEEAVTGSTDNDMVQENVQAELNTNETSPQSSVKEQTEYKDAVESFLQTDLSDDQEITTVDQDTPDTVESSPTIYFKEEEVARAEEKNMSQGTPERPTSTKNDTKALKTDASPREETTTPLEINKEKEHNTTAGSSPSKHLKREANKTDPASTRPQVSNTGPNTSLSLESFSIPHVPTPQELYDEMPLSGPSKKNSNITDASLAQSNYSLILYTLHFLFFLMWFSSF